MTAAPTCIRHDWTPTSSSYQCAHCPTTVPACTDCQQPNTATTTICTPCLNRARQIITDIRTYIADGTWATDTAGVQAIRYDKSGSPSNRDDAHLPFGLNTKYDDPTAAISALKDPTNAFRILTGWAHDWADMRDENPSDTLDYLETRTLWAAQNHPAWRDYLTEARAVRAVIRRILGLEPEREPAPCVHCGGQIIREWHTDGLDDTARCATCGIEWADVERLNYANRHTILGLRTSDPDLLVTIADAKLILPEARRGTLDTWARRGKENPDNAKFQPRGTDTRGHDLYRLGDIITAWETRKAKGA